MDAPHPVTATVAPPLFRAELRASPPTALLCLDGELDLSVVDRLHTAVDEALAQGCTALVVDLTGLGFLDCAGVGALVEARNRVRERGGRLTLTLAAPTGAVARLLRLTGADQLLEPAAG